MPSEVFQLYLLLTLKDYTSGGLNSIEARLRGVGKEGKETLRTFQQLRENMKRDLGIAAVGVGTLALMKKGIDVAGDYESAMADLRMSIQEIGPDGQLNIAKMKDEMARLEAQTVSLGNRLPGTTQDFVEMYATLKQGGLETKTILDGTGEAVANLAVITNQVPKDLAEPFAQYTQQFQLTGDEAKKLADVLGRIQFSTGLKPQELIEGSKFFQLRAGSRLGLTGLSGADVSGRLLATLRSYGLEGGIGGRELSTFVGGLSFATKEKQKALAELKKTKGIDFQLFDKEGELIGADPFAKIQNFFAQMEKLKTLSTKEKLDYGDKLFGQEGAAIANTMMRAGVEGWKKINDKVDRTAHAEEMAAQKLGTYNKKVEALKGTLTNLEVTAFMPMLDTLKPILDTANEVTGALQGWAKEHPEIAKYAGTIVGIGGVALTLYGTLRAGQTAWALWRIASSLALKGTQADAIATGGTLRGLATPIKISIIAGELIWVLGELRTLKQLIDEFEARDKRTHLEGESNLKRLQEMQKSGQPIPASYYRLQATASLGQIGREGTLREQFEGAPGEPGPAVFFKHLFGDWFSDSRPFYQKVPQAQQELFRQRAPELRSPEVMSEFIRAVQGLKGWTEEGKQNLLKLAEQSYPKSYQEGLDLFSKSLADLDNQTKQTADTLTKMNSPLMQMPTQLNNAGAAAQRFADRVDSIDLQQPSFAPAAPGASALPGWKNPFSPQVLQVPSKASGGDVLRGGLVNVHKDEKIVPAEVTRRWSEPKPIEFRPEVARAIVAEFRGQGPGAGGQGSVHHHHTTVNVNVAPGSRAADNPEELARLVAYELEIQQERAA